MTSLSRYGALGPLSSKDGHAGTSPQRHRYNLLSAQCHGKERTASCKSIAVDFTMIIRAVNRQRI